VIVRTVVVFFCLAMCVPIARAQEQESKLMDRLLKPDMELQNTDQGKKFVADHGGRMDKKATVGSFYVQKKKDAAKKFAGTRDVSTRQFGSQSFRGTKEAAVAKPQREIVNANRSVPTAGVRDVRTARDSNKIVDSREYSGKRPFLERGKSQKSLDRQNPPLTIDQVRDLLNKNK
jgi:hypothetical protein